MKKPDDENKKISRERFKIKEGTEQKEVENMHRKYRKLVSAGLVLTMAGAMTLQGCGQKEKEGKTEIETCAV